MRLSRVLAVFGAIALLVVGLVWWEESSTANSTRGVREIGDNLVSLPAGQDFVLTHTVWAGKSAVTEVWHVTYDGDQTVRMEEEGFWFFSGDSHSTTLCGVGCSASIGLGWLEGDLVATLRPDGAVEVKWPSGWDYRPYKP